MADYTTFEKRYFLLPRAEIAHLRFVLESYDGVAFARTLDSKAGLVEIAFPSTREQDAQELITALCKEASLREVAPPEEIPPL
jgi:hypothetical protein